MVSIWPLFHKAWICEVLQRLVSFRQVLPSQPRNSSSYEFKAKNIKKKKVDLAVSVEGVKVSLRKKNKKKEWVWDENKVLLMHDPIYRIFYVSHDSQDLKIFSFISRDGSSNAFHCNVFKAKRKSQAMRIVRTIGQAFDVCHKLSLQQARQEASARGSSSQRDEQPQRDATPVAVRDDPVGGEGANDSGNTAVPTQASSQMPVTDSNNKLQHGEVAKTIDGVPQQSPGSPAAPTGPTAQVGPSSFHHHLELLQQQLQLQKQQSQSAAAQEVRVGVVPSVLCGPHERCPPRLGRPMRAQSSPSQAVRVSAVHPLSGSPRKHPPPHLRRTARAPTSPPRVAHVRLLRTQLATEAAARSEAESREQQLLQQNRVLLVQLSVLVRRLRRVEVQLTGSDEGFPQSDLCLPSLTDPTSPSPATLDPADLSVFRNAFAAAETQGYSATALGGGVHDIPATPNFGLMGIAITDPDAFTTVGRVTATTSSQPRQTHNNWLSLSNGYGEPNPQAFLSNSPRGATLPRFLKNRGGTVDRGIQPKYELQFHRGSLDGVPRLAPPPTSQISHARRRLARPLPCQHAMLGLAVPLPSSSPSTSLSQGHELCQEDGSYTSLSPSAPAASTEGDRFNTWLEERAKKQHKGAPEASGTNGAASRLPSEQSDSSGDVAKRDTSNNTRLHISLSEEELQESLSDDSGLPRQRDSAGEMEDATGC
uniref:carboxyl-terminal PDZ ligand of neuronal nitric oxide synthase protein isoform X2 n=1 Tax=Myxine glutinosa TaxID=7769 RepID=UPI00358FA735